MEIKCKKFKEKGEERVDKQRKESGDFFLFSVQ